jgi:quercetin dioxygenase-like cupin family protein
MIAAVTGALGIGVFAGNVIADTPAPPVGTTILGKSLFEAFSTEAHTIPADQWQTLLRTHGESDVYAVENTFPPHSSTTWHLHPGPSLILAVNGTITNYSSQDPSCAGHDYGTGTGFVDPAGVVHQVRNNTNAPAEDIAIQVIPHGVPRKTDQPQPTNCTS